MTALLLFLLFLANAAWMYVYVAVTVGGIGLLSWTGWTLAENPEVYIPHAFVVVFGSQIILIILFYWMRYRGRMLKNRYDKVRGEHGELLTEHQKAAEENAVLRTFTEPSDDEKDETFDVKKWWSGLWK